MKCHVAKSACYEQNYLHAYAVWESQAWLYVIHIISTIHAKSTSLRAIIKSQTIHTWCTRGIHHTSSRRRDMVRRSMGETWTWCVRRTRHMAHCCFARGCCVDVMGPLLNLHIIRMCPHVRHQGVGPRERLAARLADMRLLPRMREHVLSQVADVRERLATRLTDMRMIP